MKQKLLLKTMLLLCALIAGSSSVWAAEGDVTVTISYTDIPDGYDASGTSGNFTKTVKTTNDLTIYYSGINTKSKADAAAHAYGYAMFLKNAGFVYSSIAPTGYYPSNVKVTFGSNTGTSGKAGITYGTASLNSRNSSVNGSVSKSGTCELSNSDQTKLYWNFSTTGANVQVDKIEVTYSLKGGVNPPTFSPVAGEVTKGSTVTLTQADADQIRYTLDGSAPTKTTGSVYSTPIVINEPTTIKAIAIKGDEVSGVAEASYTVVYPAVLTLDFTSNTNWAFPTSKSEGPSTYTENGYSITLAGSSGNGYYFDTTNSNLLLGKNGATLTLPAFGFNVSKIKVYGASGASGSVTFNVYVGGEAVSTAATSSQEDHEFAIKSGYQDVGTVYVIKVTNANNMRISKIEVFGNGCEAGLVTSNGWATYITTDDVEYPANTAYVVTDASVSGSSGSLTMEAVTQVPSDTPLLLKGAGAKTAKLLDLAPAAPTTNLLSVSNGTFGVDEYPYVLAKDGEGACFKQWTGTAATLDGRVVLVLDQALAAASPVFTLDSNETTGIDSIENGKLKIENSEVYNLAGQRVAQPSKGLYIVNGKKVVIK